VIKDFNNFTEVSNAFTSIGGQFILSPDKIKAKLADIKAFVFDWDGVFNNGFKGENTTGLFSESDSAGLNLMRYSYYRTTKVIPPASIITGENNPAAIFFSKRENFNVVYMQVLNKATAIAHLCSKNNISPSQVACVFDDINDLSMAKVCGLRFMVKKSAAPALEAYAVNNNFCDYITGNEQDKYPIREMCELIMAFNGTYEDSISSRINMDDTYKKFLKQRKSATLYLSKATADSFNVESI
jgi:3-deoxy-D-manno-octulosonate 8-phosphate phosphatase (KDO 8-P phosphatase)